MGEIYGGGRRRAFNDIQNALERAEDQEHAALSTGLGFEKPFMTAGGTALSRLLAEVSGGPTQTVIGAQKAFQQSPAQQFETQQAIQNVNNAMAAAGLSGSAMHQQMLSKAVTGTLGEQEQQFIQDALAGRQEDIGALLGTGQIGAGAARAGLSGELETGQSLAGLTSQIGEAQAGGVLSRAAALNQLIASILSAGKGALRGGFATGVPGAIGGGIGGFLRGTEF